jgi:energy-coupling factor transporter ATP-binding protein EcfA2
VISAQNLSVRYGDIPAICGLNLQVDEGECVLVTGPSGCGKSTLARVVTGLIPHAIPASLEGSLTVAGLDVSQCSISTLAGHIGAVFQNPSAQLFHLRVEDDVAFGPRNLGLTEREVSERVQWALEAAGATSLREHHPAELSGGQQQLVVIAAALAMRPRVLVLDEPTASLDVQGSTHVVNALERLRQELGITILLIEHRLAEVSRIVDRVVVLNHGQLVAEGNAESVFDDFRMIQKLGLRRPVERPMESWDALLSPNGQPQDGSIPLLELEGVNAGYAGNPVLSDVSLTLYRGEFVALVGDNGAGKSTLGLVAAGLLKPTSGRISYDERKRPRLGLDVSLLFQDPLDQLFTDSVDEEVSFGPTNYRCFNRINHEQSLAMADLISIRNRRPLALSAGQQQRTALAACLSLRPRLLILDEPTMGQDWGHLQRLMDFLSTLNAQGITILLITHDYKLVHHYASRVIWLEAGRIRLDGRVRERQSQGKVRTR